MTKKTTKRALLLSVVSLLLCCSMLIGSTFAWFTDSVTSGNNKIVAGNLDIELNVITKDGPKSVTELGADEKLFNVKLWEPGVVAYETFEAVNAGTLALKYQLALSTSNANVFNGRTLAEVIKVAVIDGDKRDLDREAMIAAAGDSFAAIDAAKTYKAGKLLPKDVKDTKDIEGFKSDKETFTVVLYWAPTDNDNLYNVNNGQETNDGKALSIDFNITLSATQVPYEDDAFGNAYDENAKLDAVVIKEAINKGAEDANKALEEALKDVEGADIYFDKEGLKGDPDGALAITLHFDGEESKNQVMTAFTAISDLIVTAVNKEAASIKSIEIGYGLAEKINMPELKTNVRELNGQPVKYGDGEDEKYESWVYHDLGTLMNQVMKQDENFNSLQLKDKMQACLEYTAKEGLDVEIVGMDGSKQVYRMYFALNWDEAVTD